MNMIPIQNVAFDDTATSAMGEAFDRACKSLQQFGSAPEIVANRIIASAKNGERDPEGAAQRAFSTSILVSATRCLLTYIVLPFVAPALGLAAGVGPAIGIPVGIVAIACNVLTIRRFWAADHRWRWAYTAVSLSVIVLLTVLLVEDISSLIG